MSMSKAAGRLGSPGHGHHVAQNRYHETGSCVETELSYGTIKPDGATQRKHRGRRNTVFWPCTPGDAVAPGPDSVELTLGFRCEFNALAL